MQITQQRRFNLTAAQLLQHLTQKRFYAARFAVQGIQDYRFLHFAQEDEGFVVHIERDIEVDASRIPSFAKRFVAKKMLLTTRFMWQTEAAPFIGAYEVSMGNAPVTIAGKVNIADVGEQQCEQNINIEITSSVPVVGKKIAGALAERVEEVLEKDYLATLQVLKQDVTA